MAARAFLHDSGGVARNGKRLFLRDASGVPRQAKRIFERDSSGIARLVYVLFTGQVDLYTNPGTYTETIPYGASTLVLEGWGAGASGGIGGEYSGVYAVGGGGGAGGYFRIQIDVSAYNGKTIVVTVGTGGAVVTAESSTGNAGTASTAESGTFNLSTLTADGGAPGTLLRGGLGGPASGGSTNTTGGQGQPGSHDGGNGYGGVPVSGDNGAAYGAGGNGGIYLLGDSTAGANGALKFTYT